MASIERNMISKILESLEIRLDRKLSPDEIECFSRPRSLMAYEMILDYIKDSNKAKEDIERYVKSIVKEQEQSH